MHEVRHDPLATFLTVPLLRMAELPLLPSVLTAGVLAGMTQAIVADPFSLLLPLMVTASAYDWWYGRRAARLLDTFSSEIAQVKMHSKIGAVGIVCCIRWLEWWAGEHVFQTNGWAAVVLAAGLVLEDISSVEEKRIMLGAKPIFLLSAVLSGFRSGLRRLFPEPPAPPGGVS